MQPLNIKIVIVPQVEVEEQEDFQKGKAMVMQEEKEEIMRLGNLMIKETKKCCSMSSLPQIQAYKG